MMNVNKTSLLWLIINLLRFLKINHENYNEWKFKNISYYKEKTVESKRMIN